MNHAHSIPFSTEKHTITKEELLKFDKFASFKFSFNNFCNDYVTFSNLFKNLDKYPDDDHTFLLHFYSALPNSIRNLLPVTDYTSSKQLYSAVYSAVGFKLSLSVPIKEDSDAKIIDHNVGNVADLSDAAFAIFLDQCIDAIDNADPSDSIAVDLKVIRNKLHRSTSNGTRSPRNCFYCNKPGHFIRKCHERKMNAKRSNHYSNAY